MMDMICFIILNNFSSKIFKLLNFFLSKIILIFSINFWLTSCLEFFLRGRHHLLSTIKDIYHPELILVSSYLLKIYNLILLPFPFLVLISFSYHHVLILIRYLLNRSNNVLILIIYFHIIHIIFKIFFRYHGNNRNHMNIIWLL